MRARVAWVLAGLTALLVVVDVAITAQYRYLLSEDAVAVHGFPFVNLAVLGCSVLGAVIITREDRHVIGWLLSAVGVVSAFSLLFEAYSVWVTASDGPGSRAMGGLAGWLSVLIGGQLAFGGLALLFLLAPDGRLLSRRWRWPVASLAVGELLCFAGLVTVHPTSFDLETQDLGPIRGSVYSIGFLLISIGLVASVVSMLVRMRRSRGVERQQLRLIALSVALVATGLLMLFLVQLGNGGRQTWAASLPLFFSYVMLPILFAVAVLRYRLYDIDVIINRAVVIVATTAFAAVCYTTLVVLVGNQVNTRAGGFWLSLLGIASVALAFQPLRHAVIRLSDRLAYGVRAKPYEALSSFSRRLAETPSPSTLLPAVAEAAGRAVSARGATVTLDSPGHGAAVATTWGDAPDGTTVSHRLPMLYDGVALGAIMVRLPKGRALRTADQRLLAALADQTAVAVRNISMEVQLADRVAELDRTTRELALSRSRIIAADDAARQALERAITSDVLPHLSPMPPMIAQAQAAVAAGREANGLDELVARTNTALESLRELTRGIFPTQLARAGLAPTLTGLLARTERPHAWQVEDAVARERFPSRVEAAVYFCCSQLLPAMDDGATISLGVIGGSLVLRVEGVALDAVDIRAVLDRVEAVDGELATSDRTVTLTVAVAREPADGVLAGPAIDGRGPGR